ncbi:MCE family protein [Blastococcus saxobsidens]|uniref:ABC-type transport system, mce-related protein n=1 Tax=Blastococcus saxobsidens (strain DD2) TaxID=1146883 RepID=H6RMV1_BLASD|nr:MCE family protein [Blastococcus saxobsidens]CCG05139.1 ABC-type transport system, mce-related protein [Blastococcus saxobsidens DD2]
MSTTIRIRLQGLAFLVVLALLLGLSVAVYNKAFTEVARVTLETDTAGNQLQEASDVKVRGVLVGEVREVAASAEGATIELAIEPEHLDQIPADVTARLLPKTLFGERYVSLELPQDAGGERLADGDVIGQDRTSNAIELQRVIDDTLPLLQAVHPDDLSFTLGAVADALRGRGDALGANLAATGDYFGEINTVLPELQADISGLADFAETYEGAADDLLAVLDNLAVTNTTVVGQAEQLRRTFTVGAGSADLTADFLERNERNLISLAETSRPVLGLFAEYSPIYPCLLEGLSRSVPRIGETFGMDGDPALNLNIQFTFPPRNPYLPGDQPVYADAAPPDCRGLDDIDTEIAQAQAGEYYCPYPPDDGVRSPESAERPEPACYRGGAVDGGNPDNVPRTQAGQSLPDVLAGSTAELDFVRSILAYQTGADPEDVSDLGAATLAPILRGKSVMLR